MNKDKYFEESLRKARRKVYYLLNERAKQFSRDISLRLCECFATRARRRLVQNSTPKNGESAQQVQDLAYSINVRQLDNGSYSVTIPADNEGLFMFLEFGTGILGESAQHPEANDVNWEYNVNADAWFRAGIPNGGWVYRYDRKDKTGLADEGNYPYLDANDIYPLTREHRKYTSTSGRVKSYTRKDGTIVKSYTRKRPEPTTTYNERATQRSNRVMSWGLYPVRYIYDTKQEIYELLYTLKSYQKGKLTIRDVYNAIDELERRPV